MLPGSTPYAHFWVMGSDPRFIGPPYIIIGGAVLHALSQAERWLDAQEPNKNPIDQIAVQPGTWGTTKTLLSWFNDGQLGFASAAASEVALAMQLLASKLACPLLSEELPGGFIGGGPAEDDPIRPCPRRRRAILPGSTPKNDSRARRQDCTSPIDERRSQGQPKKTIPNR